MALDAGALDLHDVIKIRLPGKALPAEALPEGWDPAEAGGRVPLIETTVGRVVFNESFPAEFEYVNHHVQKGDVGALVDQCVSRFELIWLRDPS